MRSNRALLPLFLAIAVALPSIHFSRSFLAEVHGDAKREHDSYLLPSAGVTQWLSLGYRAALADFIFAHVLVSYGQHFQEKRRFEVVADYLDAITTLDPTFREPYRLADTLIVLQPEPARLVDHRAARRLQERGLRQFPYDSELWLIAGQYLAYIAANYVPEAEREEWQLEGARKLARSCEVMGSNENIPYHCITAAYLFNQSGRQEAALGFLDRVLAISDDPAIQGIALGYLGRLIGEVGRERRDERNRRLRGLWARDLTFIPFDLLLLLGPKFDSARCAGVPAPMDDACATSFRDWGERLDL